VPIAKGLPVASSAFSKPAINPDTPSCTAVVEAFSPFFSDDGTPVPTETVAAAPCGAFEGAIPSNNPANGPPACPPGSVSNMVKEGGSKPPGVGIPTFAGIKLICPVSILFHLLSEWIFYGHGQSYLPIKADSLFSL
jgi:hypothetical protein